MKPEVRAVYETRTREMIKVMEAYLRGAVIECRNCDGVSTETGWYEVDDPMWNWCGVDYRVKENWIPMGTKFKYSNGWTDDTFVLAQVDADKINLINLRDGNRWTEPMKVKMVFREESGWNASAADFQKLVGKHSGEFVKVE
jgi:hypothetical protein